MTGFWVGLGRQPEGLALKQALSHILPRFFPKIFLKVDNHLQQVATIHRTTPSLTSARAGSNPWMAKEQLHFIIFPLNFHSNGKQLS